MKNDYVRAMFTSSVRSTLDHFAFPKTNKGSIQKLPLDDLIEMARTLLDMRYDYHFCVLRMPDFLRRKDRNYDIDNILQRAKDLYERNGLELAFRRDDNPSNYKDIHVNAVVTDRIRELIWDIHRKKEDQIYGDKVVMIRETKKTQDERQYNSTNQYSTWSLASTQLVLLQ